MRQRISFVALAALIIILSGCKMGPNYARPTVPAAPAYRGPDNAQVTTTESLGDQKWSTVFHDPALADLITKALKNNFDVRIAVTRIQQAQAQVTITRSNQFPTLSAGPQVIGTRQPGIPGIFGGYSYLADALSGTASWNLDFWGRYRRATEAARANLLATEWGQRAVLRSVVETVAAAYFQLREYDLELEIAKRTLDSRQQSLKLTQTLEQGGATSLVDVRQAEQLLEEASATIPQSEQAIQQTENLISILLGENPGPVARGLALTEQPLPETIPAGLPSQLLARRPDIQQAEQNLVAANAEIGVARAQLFPQISLTGTFGVQSIGLHNLFDWGLRTWNWSGALSQPIFNAGALRANVRLSEAEKEQMVLTYQQSIQGAFREVSDSLISYTKARQYREHVEKLSAASQDAAKLSDVRYQGGVTSYLEVLTSQTNYFSAQLTLARAQLSERLALVQIYNALGGGWQP